MKRSIKPSVVHELKLTDDESQSDVEESLNSSLKRKRGRPTKNGKPSVPVQKKPVVPRGRGRPPKVKVFGRGRPKKIQIIDEPEAAENSISSAEEMEDSDIPKSNAAIVTPGKGSGRFKKA